MAVAACSPTSLPFDIQLAFSMQQSEILAEILTEKEKEIMFNNCRFMILVILLCHGLRCTRRFGVLDFVLVSGCI